MILTVKTIGRFEMVYFIGFNLLAVAMYPRVILFYEKLMTYWSLPEIIERTTEFSFVLKSSEYGVGVFAVHDIKAGTHLRLFGDQLVNRMISVARRKQDVPEYFRQFCVGRGDTLYCPEDFGQMALGWYINHSKEPNAVHRDYLYFALRDIKAGEEITINYNILEEPEESKEEYYRE